MRKRISLSLPDKMIKSVDAYAEALSDTRSGAIESILQEYMNAGRYCVILAGGGDYLITDGEYRPFLDIGGRTLIQRIVEKVVGQSYKNIIIIGTKEVVTRCFGILANGESLGCSVAYIEEKARGDSANTLKLASAKVKGTFLFVPCDHYFDFDLRKLEKVHRRSGYPATLAIYGGIRHDGNRSSVVELDGNDIINYWDTPSVEKTTLVSTMIAFAEPEIFTMIPDRKFSLHKDLFPELSKKGVLGGAILSGKFVNIHTKQDAEAARRLVK